MDHYNVWITEFPLKPLWNNEDLKKATDRLAAVCTVPRHERDAGQNAYIGVLRELIATYTKAEEDRLERIHATDAEVLKFCMAAAGLDDASPKDVIYVGNKCGIPPVNILGALRSKRRLSRDEINKICVLFDRSPLLFDTSAGNGPRLSGRFRVTHDYNNHYVITDLDSGQTVSRPYGQCPVYIKDCNSINYQVPHDSIGFEHALWKSLNDNPDGTLMEYFPKVWAQELAKTDEVTALKAEAEKELLDVTRQLNAQNMRGAS